MEINKKNSFISIQKNIDKNCFKESDSNNNSQKVENKSLKEFFLIEFQKLNKKIEVIENKNKILKEKYNNTIYNLSEKIKSIEKENVILKEEIKKKENKMNEIEEKIQRLFYYITEQNQFKGVKSLKIHDDIINSISLFPSGNIISVSYDKSMKIFDRNFKILQIIKNGSWINYVDVKDENNFVVCLGDKRIITYVKKENTFQINKIINNAHDDYINKIIYQSNGNLISCGSDNKIKIWEEIKNNYQNIINLNHYDQVFSILLLEDKNILVSSGYDGTILWNLNNFELIYHFIDTYCGSWNAISRIGEDKIIVHENNDSSLKVISISEKKVIEEIVHPFYSFGICYIEKMGIFLVGGVSNDIKIYRSDNYKCINTIKNAHSKEINGFIELKNGKIASYGWDQTIKIWSF